MLPPPTPLDPNNPPQAPLTLSASAPITDPQGRIHYIVDLRDDATQGYPDINPPQDGFADYHKPKMRHLLKDMEQQHTLKATGLTSWVGNSFSAFLTPAQVDKLRKDTRVTLITQDAPVEFSARWTNTSFNGEITSWGANAVGGGRPGSYYRFYRVYVLDAGVGYHVDLPNVIERVSPTYGVSPVGCYAHATHVAGIIGAPRNYQGVVGVDPGVLIVSVAVGTLQNSTYSCSNNNVNDPAALISSVGAGLDLIYRKIQERQQVGIVNISLNGFAFKLGQTLGNKMRTLATPSTSYGYYYYGAFIAQSAGNRYERACGSAYDATNSTDGIMVVGAINDNGQPVTRAANGGNGFVNAPNIARSEPGSNYGSCVEAWAPGNVIYSTWGPLSSPYIQSGTTTYSNYVNLSGTSMAAPHVTGVAAYLAESRYLSTPQQIESAVRSSMYWLGTYDTDVFAVYMPYLY